MHCCKYVKSDKRGYISFNSLLLSTMKSYYEELGLFKNISDEGLNEIENKEKQFFHDLNRVIFQILGNFL